MGARETRFRTHYVKTYAKGGGSHAHRHPPGCNRADDSSLALFLKTTKPDKREDTKGAGMLKFLRLDVFTPQIFGHVPLFSGAAAN